MTNFPRSPAILKSGLVLLDPATFQPQRVVVLQYNPDQLTRTLQVQAMSGEGGDRSESLRLKGAPIETFKLEAEIDATDQLEFPDQNPDYRDYGIFPQLAVLESLITPTSDQLSGMETILSDGTIEIAAVEAPLALFVWSTQRVAPVRVTEFSITEEAFDIKLNPIRAKVSLSLRVLTNSDFSVGHKGAQYFMAYVKNKETLAQKATNGDTGRMGSPRFI
jgi:hypothetical protein